MRDSGAKPDDAGTWDEIDDLVLAVLLCRGGGWARSGDMRLRRNPWSAGTSSLSPPCSSREIAVSCAWNVRTEILASAPPKRIQNAAAGHGHRLLPL